jgi:hypothetical protein
MPSGCRDPIPAAETLTTTYLTSHAMYVQRNIEARSCYHCCSGKATSITQSLCVFVALGIQRAMRMHHVICGLPRFRIFFPLFLINGTIFGKKVIEHKMCVLTFCTTFV